MKTLRTTLANRLRTLMDTTLLDTQDKVADVSGIAQSSVQRILKTEQSATVDLVERLAKAFNITPSAAILLENKELALLTLWSKVSQDDQARILKQLVELSRGPDLLTFTHVEPIPKKLQAATNRASARPPLETDGERKSSENLHRAKRKPRAG